MHVLKLVEKKSTTFTYSFAHAPGREKLEILFNKNGGFSPLC